MPLEVVVGLGWGDEGKGKIVDFLSRDASVVARFSGGANAGHTVRIGDRRIVLHQIPTGMIREGVTGLLGAGCVIDPTAFLEECRSLRENGVSVLERLMVSHHAHFVHPCYLLEEKADEEARGSGAIGTTLRGIGPAYVHKYARNGLRVEDALDPAGFGKSALAILGEGAAPALRAKVERFVEDAISIAGMAADPGPVILDALGRGEMVLAEGAQGTLLDPDSGTYPFVTCGSCVSAAACISLGVGPSKVDEVVGVVKAYSTRVGSGPFPTELDGPVADHIRKRGNEYGTTTGRPRRCGWFDASLSAYASRINGCDWLALTMLDVLGGLEVLRISTGYSGGPARLALPGGRLGLLTPVYEDLPGWTGEISAVSSWSDLPARARSYAERIGALTGVPVRLVSTGPDRTQTVWREA